MKTRIAAMALFIATPVLFADVCRPYQKAQFPAAGELTVNPTFVNCSVEYGAAAPCEGLKIEYRAEGAESWQAVPERETQYYPVSHGYRASIRDLKEDSPYRLRLTAGGKTVAEAGFRTWKSVVPVARTVWLEAPFDRPLVIDAKGSPDGWVRYTAKPGTVLDFSGMKKLPILIQGAEYVLLDDLTIRGNPYKHVIEVRDSSFVRLRNLDLSGWGRVGEQRFDRKGYIHDPDHDNGHAINYDAAIWIGGGAFGTVVERSYVHDPLGRAHSWFYSHPAGPEAVMMDSPRGSTVIRWNDFVGSDDHRWNDAVEGTGNFSDVGGFNRDADVYGNFMAFCNDDCIEMDGAQRNVRNFDNRYESALCGVSIQGCMVGPSYVYRNAFTRLGDEFGSCGQLVKTGGGDFGPEARAFLEDNLFLGRGKIQERELLTMKVDGSRFVDTEDALDPAVPVRPLAFTLDRARLSPFRVGKGAVEPASATVTVRGGDAETRFRIVKNEVAGWFEVTPAEGVVPAHGEVKLAVTVRTDRTAGRRFWRGAFLVRTAEGLSRPVSVYAETDYVPPYRAAKPGDVAVYSADFKEGEFVRLPKASAPRTCVLEVPKAGRYYFMVHGRGRGKIAAGVDGAAPETSKQQGSDYPYWTVLAPGCGFGGMVRYYDLAAGRHTVTLAAQSGDFVCDGLVLTDAPISFEPSPHAAVEWPAARDPARISRRIAAQLLSTSPHDYRPKGFVGKQGYGWDRMIQYSVVSLWVNALECARLSGDRALERELTGRYLDYLPGGRFESKCSRPYHVDDAIFGALPLEVYLLSGDRRCLEQGLRYADIQFAEPCEGTINERHALSENVQRKLFAAGYSPQTRLWIDDMYMITALQSQAFRATGRREYIDRAAKEMVLYLHKLQIKDGPDAGLFYHAPESPFVWGRGAGWMAAGMTLVLSCLPEDSEYRGEIMAGYRLMMAKLLEHQRANGLWGQLVNDAASWDETSGSAMFAYAFIVGTRRGWLEGDAYLDAAGRAWSALTAKLDEDFNLRDVCEGTGHKNDRDWYMNRARQTGDPHGQAPMLWICRELLEKR